MSASEQTLNDNLIERIALGDLLRRRAADAPNVEAVVDFVGNQRRALSYAELNRRVNQTVRGLRRLGLRQGDKVALLCSNRIEFFQFAFASYKAGMVLLPINFVQKLEDIRYNLAHAQADALVFEASLADLALASAAALPALRSRIVIGECAHPDCVSAQSLLAGDASEIEDIVIGDRDVAQLLYTSGTTSKPKGVETSHMSLYMASLSLPLSLGIRLGHRHLIVLPVFHCAAMALALSTLQTRGTVVLLSAFEPVQVLRLFGDEQINGTAMLPMMWRALLHQLEGAPREFSGLEFGIYAMAPIDAGTRDTLRRAFGCQFHLASGQSEFTPAACAYLDGSQTEQAQGNFWGLPTLVTDQAVLDEQGRLLPAGEVGEICWRGPQVMNGYFNNPEASSQVRQFGWHHSGDLGYVDRCGQLIFVDRKKDMIKTGGENVSSGKIEQALMGMPQLADVAAFGVPHPHWVEAVCVAVTAVAGAHLDEQALIEYARKHLSGFEVPKKVFVLSDFPRTGTGKIKKNLLRETYWKTFAEE